MFKWFTDLPTEGKFTVAIAIVVGVLLFAQILV